LENKRKKFIKDKYKEFEQISEIGRMVKVLKLKIDKLKFNRFEYKERNPFLKSKSKK